MRTRLYCALVLSLVVDGICQAALFSGPSGFSQTATTQLGLLTDNLTITDNANGFVVTGQVIVAVPPTPVAGTLVSWVVERPLDPSFAPLSIPMITTTILDGYSQPPPGVLGTTAGICQSYFTNVGTSVSQIPISMPGGLDVWSNIVVNSVSFGYVSGGTNFLRQEFFVDGVYLGGPGGNWVVDVPVTTIASVVPEPAAAALLAVGLAGARRVRRGR